MLASLWEYANPTRFMALSGRLMPWVWLGAVLCLSLGLIWGFFFTPDDARQGAAVKIIFLHVPAAFFAINAWLMMLVASLIWLVRRHHVSALAARAAAPVGAVFTVIALITGALWGQGTWGTWWQWEPRLTAFLVLYLFYVGYIALWEAIETAETAADLTSMLCLVGSVFALLSRYAAQIWTQGLHQGSTLSVDRETHIDNVFYFPLMAALLGFFLLFLALVLLRTRTHIRTRRLSALMAREVAR